MQKKILKQVDDFINYMDELVDVENWNSTLRTFDHKVDIFNRKVNGERYALIQNDKDYEKGSQKLKKHLIKKYHKIPDLNHFTATFYNEYQNSATNEKLKYYLNGIYFVYTKEKNRLQETDSIDSEFYHKLFNYYIEEFSESMDSDYYKKDKNERVELINASFLGIDTALSTIYEQNISRNQNPYISYYYESGVIGIELFEMAEVAELLSDYAYRTYPHFFHLYITPKDISLMCTPFFINEEQSDNRKLLMSFACFLAKRLENLMVVKEHNDSFFMMNLPSNEDLMRQCDLFFQSNDLFHKCDYEQYELVMDYSVDIYEVLMTIWMQKMEQLEAKKVYKEKSKIYR